MSNLTLRIFLAFWLIIGVLVGIAGIAGYSYAERMREARENFEMEDTVIAASNVLNDGGREALTRWLREQPRQIPIRILVVDQAGDELLGRELSPHSKRILNRYARRRHDWSPQRRDRPNLREARPLNRLRGPDGSVYVLLAEPKRDLLQQWIGLRAGPAFLILAIIVSGLVSWALARAITRPVRSFRDATVAIASGQLDTRVATSMRTRRDEIGLLAHDLDAMAERLEESAERRRELTRNVSHELRSPLARLRVALELARRDAGDRPEFTRIDAETERLDEMIGQLLRYSRVDEAAGEMELVDLRDLLERVVEDANFECRAGGLESISVRMDDGEPLHVRAHPATLVSLFENLLRNAIRHAPEESTVRVAIARDDDEVVVRVEDRGNGVPEADLERIFQPFYRSPAALAEGKPGTGLGLAIAARAAETHGGGIRAENLPDGGFAISVRLPLGAG